MKRIGVPLINVSIEKHAILLSRHVTVRQYKTCTLPNFFFTACMTDTRRNGKIKKKGRGIRRETDEGVRWEEGGCARGSVDTLARQLLL